jgi:hypothetical protein
MPVVIDGYLTEVKLANALRQLMGSQWLGSQVKLPGSPYRWDAAFQLESTHVLVEFDGDDHYCNTIKIMVDRKKDLLAFEQESKLVRIPYWVQLDNVTIQYYFGFPADILPGFRHGFITTKVFPASFCELGIERFRREFEDLPVPVREAVSESLRDRIQEYAIEYVLPKSLRYIVSK